MSWLNSCCKSTTCLTGRNAPLAVRFSPQGFGKLIADEVARWREVAAIAGLQPQ